MRSEFHQRSWTDVAEKLLCSAVFAYFLAVYLSNFIDDPNFVSGIYLVDQTVVVVFLLIRREARAISERGMDYAIAAAGTMLPLLAVPPSGNAVVPIGFCLFLMLAGTVLHIGAKLSLGRSFGLVAADRGVKAEGAYRIVRHPMYLGYMLVHAGMLLAGPSLWNVAIFSTAWILLVFRVEAEERILSGNPDYKAFQSKTRYKLFPGLF